MTQLVLLGYFAVGYAQESNILLDRSFWKSNPSVDVVKEKIAEGNDPAELNIHAFDAVSYALIEKVDNSTILFLLEQEGNGMYKLLLFCS